MTPEQEIDRYHREFAAQWDRLLTTTEFAKAIENRNAVKVGEIAIREVRGNFRTQSEAKKYGDYF